MRMRVRAHTHAAIPINVQHGKGDLDTALGARCGLQWVPAQRLLALFVKGHEAVQVKALKVATVPGADGDVDAHLAQLAGCAVSARQRARALPGS